MKRSALSSLALLVVLGSTPAGAERDSCRYLEESYRDGRVLCQSETMWRCDDGDWRGLDKRCYNGQDYGSVKEISGVITSVTQKTFIADVGGSEDGLVFTIKRTSFEYYDETAAVPEELVHHSVTIYYAEVDNQRLVYRVVADTAPVKKRRK